MPNRMIRDWTDSTKVNSLDAPAERFFVRLMMKADDFGRFHAEPRLLRSMLFPLLVDSVRDADCSRWLAACEKAGLIVVYESRNKKLLEIVNFGQRLRSSTSKFDPPTSAAVCPQVADNCQQPAAECGRPPPEGEAETETKSKTEAQAEDCTESSEADAAVPPPVLMFPVRASEGLPKEWPLYQDRIADWQECYPGIDAAFEARKARQWCIANVSQQKTARGMAAFLNRWMARAQDDATKFGRTTTPRHSNANGSGSAVSRERDRMREQAEVLARYAAQDDAEGIHSGDFPPLGIETHGESG